MLRRALKWAALAVVAVIGLAALLLGGLFVYNSIDRTDTFVLLDARFENPQFLGPLQERADRNEDFHVYAHRLSEGAGVIVGYRFYSNGTTAIDDEHYRKATLWIPDPPSQPSFDVPFGGNAKAVLVFSRGGSAWPEAGCSGYGTGLARVERHGQRYKIHITASISPAGRTVFPDACKLEAIDLAFEAYELRHSALTPWLGLRGKHPYDETYRQVGA